MYKYQLFIIYDVFCNFPMAGDNVRHMWYNMSNDKFYENSVAFREKAVEDAVRITSRNGNKIELREMRIL